MQVFICICIIQACECDVNGSKSIDCDEDGKCSCNDNIIGDKCNECADGYAKFPDCTGNLLLKFCLKMANSVILEQPVDAIHLDLRNVKKLANQQTPVIKKLDNVLANVMLKEQNVINANLHFMDFQRQKEWTQIVLVRTTRFYA